MSNSGERVCFSSLFESLGKAVAEQQKPGLSDELKRIGVDFEHLQSAYPVEKWKEATSLVATRLFPDLSAPVGEYKVGQLVSRQYEKTIVGAAMMALLRVVGPIRSVSRVTRSFRTANNYTEDKFTKINDREYELWLNELHVPYVHQGAMQAALEMIGAKDCVVEITRRDQQGTTFRVKWAAER